MCLPLAILLFAEHLRYLTGSFVPTPVSLVLWKSIGCYHGVDLKLGQHQVKEDIHSDQKIYILHCYGIGRIAIMICKDFLITSYLKILADIIKNRAEITVHLPDRGTNRKPGICVIVD